MRTLAPIAVATGLLAVALSATSAGAVTAALTASSAPTRTATATACPLDAKAAATSAAVIAEVVVRHAAHKAPDGTLTVAVQIEDVLKGGAKKAPATLVVTGVGCSSKIIQQARAKDVLLILGTPHGTQLRVKGAGPAALVGDQACQVEKVLGKTCEAASTGVVFTDLAAGQPQRWLRIAAPGLAAIIVSVLGLLLLRLRRR